MTLKKAYKLLKPRKTVSLLEEDKPKDNRLKRLKKTLKQAFKTLKPHKVVSKLEKERHNQLKRPKMTLKKA